MKRTTNFFAVILLATMTMFVAGCNKEKTESNNNADNPINYNTDDWVDLGLPSGLLWATRNVGATSPTDFGDYFAWGETAPKSSYGKDNLLYYNQTSDEWMKYNGTDGLTTLQADDDAAIANYGGRTPMAYEWKELNENTTSEWVTENDVVGRRFTAENGKSIFIPAAGYRYGSQTYYAGEFAFYWTSSLNMNDPALAWYFNFDTEDVYWDNSYPRSNALNVRAVMDAQ